VSSVSKLRKKLMKFLEMRRFDRRRRKIQAAYDVELADARAAKDWDRVRQTTGLLAHELGLLKEEEDSYLTKELRARARKFTVPLPPIRDERGNESESWQQGSQMEEWTLTTKGRRAIEDEIDRVRKASQEHFGRWFGWLTAAVAGGYALFLHLTK